MKREAMAVRDASAGYASQVNMPVVPEGYKQTDVGVIPGEWACAQIASLGDGKVPPVKAGPFGSSITKDQYVPYGYKVYGQEQVIRGDFLYGDYYISAKKYRELESCAVRPGDILLSLVGTLGKLLEIPDEAPQGVINPRLLRLSLDRQRVVPRFLKYLFESEGVQTRLERQAQGGTMGVLNAGVLQRFSIALPPLNEQRAIATALSDVDALLEALDRLIAKKRDIKQAAMQQLLTAQTRLPGFEGEWALLNMAKNSTLKARIGWQGLTTAEYLKSGNYGLVTGTDFSGGMIVWEGCNFVEKNRYDQDVHIQLKENDVLVTKDGTIGKVAFIDCLPFPATLNSGVFVIRPLNNSYNPKYLYYVLMSQVFTGFLNKLAAGSTISHLYQKDFVSFEFLAPPTKQEQSSIAAILSAMDAEIGALKKRRAKTAALKQAMTQELLTGRVRLIDPVSRARMPEHEKLAPRKANVHFMRSVFAAEIVERLHHKPTFGHVKLEKVLYLAEHLCDVDTGSTYRRKAAGPYDNQALRSIDSQLRRQRWFDARKVGHRYVYEPLEKRGAHRLYFDRYFSRVRDVFDNVIEMLREMNTERCEIVATLYAAWKDLLQENGFASDEQIVHEVLNNWHDSKKRIPEERWRKALEWMRSKGITPSRD